MNPDALLPLIPITAIIMIGLVKIARHWKPGVQPGGTAASDRLEARLEAVEHDLASLQTELSETQERLDFAERMLAQTREGKRLPPNPLSE